MDDFKPSRPWYSFRWQNVFWFFALLGVLTLACEIPAIIWHIRNSPPPAKTPAKP